jgi:hypothetical protein
MHVESALSIFSGRANAEFDDLRNSLDSQIRSVYTLAQYTEGICTDTEKLFMTLNSNIIKLKEQLAKAHDW